MGKPKGCLQVLLESRFMGTSKDVCTYYILCGREDNYGNTIIETGLRGLMRKCINFIKEETILQTNAFKMVERKDHIIIEHTPKCHPRIYGEGIEYFWGCAKNYYRRLSLNKKKVKKISKKLFKRPYHDITLPQSGSVFFIYVHGSVSMHTN